MRPSGRANDALRPVAFETDVSKYAEGSCLAKFGDTHVLCTASIEERVPPFLRNSGEGWVTAEYGMLPRSTDTRTDRGRARGKRRAERQEIQRLIGRSLRAVTDLDRLRRAPDQGRLRRHPGRRRHPDGAITGGYVALYLAFRHMPEHRRDLGRSRSTGQVAAVSCGICERRRRARPRLCRGFDGAGRRQFRADRQRPHRRGAGHRGGGALFTRTSSWRCSTWPSKGVARAAAQRSARRSGSS